MQLVKVYISLFLLSFITISCNSSDEQKKQLLEATSFQEKINDIDNPQIVDVRTPREFESGHIENAQNININSESFDEKIAELDKERPVLVYCRSGGRSGRAASELASKGFKEIYDMKGGITAWKSNDLELVAGESGIRKLKGISEEEFRKIIFHKDKLVLVDFSAEWCTPCKELTPILRKLSKENSGNFNLVEIDVDENEEIAKNLNIQGLPTLKLYKNGKQIWNHLGFISKEDMESVILKFS